MFICVLLGFVCSFRFVPFRLFVRSFVRSFVRLFVRSFIRLFVSSLASLLVCLFVCLGRVLFAFAVCLCRGEGNVTFVVCVLLPLQLPFGRCSNKL